MADSGATLPQLKKYGCWTSDRVAEGYYKKSIHGAMQNAARISNALKCQGDQLSIVGMEFQNKLRFENGSGSAQRKARSGVPVNDERVVIEEVQDDDDVMMDDLNAMDLDDVMDDNGNGNHNGNGNGNDTAGKVKALDMFAFKKSSRTKPRVMHQVNGQSVSVAANAAKHQYAEMFTNCTFTGNVTFSMSQ